MKSILTIVAELTAVGVIAAGVYLVVGIGPALIVAGVLVLVGVEIYGIKNLERRPQSEDTEEEPFTVSEDGFEYRMKVAE